MRPHPTRKICPHRPIQALSPCLNTKAWQPKREGRWLPPAAGANLDATPAFECILNHTAVLILD